MVITLSGVTGVGKSYLKKQIENELQIKPQVIVTTRQRRIGEKEGIDKKFVKEKEFEKLKNKKDIIVTFEFLGNKYGYPREKMESLEDSIVELHYSIIYQLKKEVKNTFSIYIIPENIEIAKQKLKQRKLPKSVEEQRINEIEEHNKIFSENEDLRNQFDYILYNDYTRRTVDKIIEVIRKKIKEEENEEESNCRKLENEYVTK